MFLGGIEEEHWVKYLYKPWVWRYSLSKFQIVLIRTVKLNFLFYVGHLKDQKHFTWYLLEILFII